MGCIYANQKEEKNDEITKNEDNLEEKIQSINNNLEQNDEIFGLANQEGAGLQLKQDNNNNQNEEDYIEKVIEDKNTKYADYPEKMTELINKIRNDPVSYADVIEDSIQNINVSQEDDETKPKIIQKKKVKVALCREEPAFRETSDNLRSMELITHLEFKNDIYFTLTNNED